MGLEAPPGRHLGAEAARAALPGAAVPGVAVPGVARAVLRHRAPGRLASRVAPLSGRRRGTPDRSPAAARALAQPRAEQRAFQKPAHQAKDTKAPWDDARCDREVASSGLVVGHAPCTPRRHTNCLPLGPNLLPSFRLAPRLPFFRSARLRVPTGSPSNTAPVPNPECTLRLWYYARAHACFVGSSVRSLSPLCSPP